MIGPDTRGSCHWYPSCVALTSMDSKVLVGRDKHIAYCCLTH